MESSVGPWPLDTGLRPAADFHSPTKQGYDTLSRFSWPPQPQQHPNPSPLPHFDKQLSSNPCKLQKRQSSRTRCELEIQPRIDFNLKIVVNSLQRLVPWPSNIELHSCQTTFQLKGGTWVLCTSRRLEYGSGFVEPGHKEEESKQSALNSFDIRCCMQAT